MAERRMFAKSVVESDSFMDMPAEAQALYFHLNMGADDDGFCDNPRTIMRACGASADTMKLLAAKKFILTFDKNDGFIIVVKHWRLNNYIRKDTYHETKYKEFMRELYFDENQSYSKNPGDGHVPCVAGSLPAAVTPLPQESNVPVTEPSRVRDESLTQDRIGKDRTDKGSIGESKRDTFDQFWDEFPKKTGDIRQAYQEYLLAIEDAKPEELLEALRKQVEAADEDDLKYFHGAAVWLRNREWKKPVTASKKKPARKFEQTDFENF